jgi:hypothetical protein
MASMACLILEFILVEIATAQEQRERAEEAQHGEERKQGNRRDHLPRCM